jgi:putative heme iron utilization protein
LALLYAKRANDQLWLNVVATRLFRHKDRLPSRAAGPYREPQIRVNGAMTSTVSSSETPLPGAMPDRLPENATAPADFDPKALAKTLLRSVRAGTLATLDRNTGHPFASLVNVATDADGSPVILVSRLSTHTANIEIDGRASMLLAQTGKGDPLAHPRLTVLGQMVQVARPSDDENRVRRRFLARHPKSELYAGFGDFSFWRLTIASAHLNGGFARAADLKAEDVRTELAGAADLVAAEADAVAHMNADHAEACRLYATRLLGEPDGAWKLTGIDPDGADLALNDRTARLAFPQRVTEPGQLRQVLVTLAAQARAA